MQISIEIRKKDSDTRTSQINDALGTSILDIIDVYRVSAETELPLERIIQCLSNPILDKYIAFTLFNQKTSIFTSGDKMLFESDKWNQYYKYPSNDSWVIEKTFLPGVKDLLQEIVFDVLSSLLGNTKISIETAILYVGQGPISDLNHLYNPVIEKVSLIPISEKKITFCGRNMKKDVFYKESNKIDIAQLDVINQQNCLNLSDIQIKAIADYAQSKKRQYITDIELESIAQTWSEHCKHNIMSYPIDDLSEGIFKGYIRKSTEYIMKKNPDLCVSVFSDNAGAIKFDDDNLVCVKVETHNSPSALEPYGGAMTGILGVNRDILGFGLGAKPIANYYVFCVDQLDNAEQSFYRDKNLTKPKLNSYDILNGVIKGVNVGGNCSGIPTPQGGVLFSTAFCGKPLIFVGCAGLIPKKIQNKLSHLKNPAKGDLIVIIGGKTGKDGIHGATFSSSTLGEENFQGTEIQLGDPFVQKKLSDAIIKEARDLGLYNSITDNGAGGFSSSIGEMGRQGFTVDLERVTVKSCEMYPWEIWVSESQERMTLAVPQEHIELFQEIMKKHDVECSVIGIFNESGRGIVKMHGQVIFDLDMNFLHDGNPPIHLVSQHPDFCSEHSTASSKSNVDPMQSEIRKTHIGTDLSPTFKNIEQALSHPNVRSKKFISRQYDHEVQGSSILKPLQGKNEISADATVIRPVFTSECCLAQSHAIAVINQDPYQETCVAIEKTIINLVSVGADPKKIALLDNFCWSDPYNPERLWQLKETARACHDHSIAFMTPFISGKDSMFNDFKGYNKNTEPVTLSNAPTILITGVGILDSYEHVVSLEAKIPGDQIMMLNLALPHIRLAEVLSQYHEAIKHNLVASAICISIGGILSAVAKSVIASGYGATMNSHNVDLFKDSLGIVVTIAPDNVQAFEHLLSGYVTNLGTVTTDDLLKLNGATLSTVQEALSAYHTPLTTMNSHK